ncbi:hypothetical protein SSCG_01283 [Streptomyces clavuligerus]|nr:hypothetical protein SSCG_01283 [Streptomyces clavuligerus]
MPSGAREGLAEGADEALEEWLGEGPEEGAGKGEEGEVMGCRTAFVARKKKNVRSWAVAPPSSLDSVARAGPHRAEHRAGPPEGPFAPHGPLFAPIPPTPVDRPPVVDNSLTHPGGSPPAAAPPTAGPPAPRPFPFTPAPRPRVPAPPRPGPGARRAGPGGSARQQTASAPGVTV